MQQKIKKGKRKLQFKISFLLCSVSVVKSYHLGGGGGVDLSFARNVKRLQMTASHKDGKTKKWKTIKAIVD